MFVPASSRESDLGVTFWRLHLKSTVSNEFGTIRADRRISPGLRRVELMIFERIGTGLSSSKNLKARVVVEEGALLTALRELYRANELLPAPGERSSLIPTNFLPDDIKAEQLKLAIDPEDINAPASYLWIGEISTRVDVYVHGKLAWQPTPEQAVRIAEIPGCAVDTDANGIWFIRCTYSTEALRYGTSNLDLAGVFELLQPILESPVK